MALSLKKVDDPCIRQRHQLELSKEQILRYQVDDHSKKYMDACFFMIEIQFLRIIKIHRYWYLLRKFWYRAFNQITCIARAIVKILQF